MKTNRTAAIALTAALAFGGISLPALSAHAAPAGTLQSCQVDAPDAWRQALDTTHPRLQANASAQLQSVDARGQLLVSEQSASSPGNVTVKAYTDKSLTQSRTLLETSDRVQDARRYGNWLAYFASAPGSSDMALTVKDLANGKITQIASGNWDTLRPSLQIWNDTLFWVEKGNEGWELKSYEFATKKMDTEIEVKNNRFVPHITFVGKFLVNHYDDVTGDKQIVQLDGKKYDARDDMTKDRDVKAAGDKVAYLDGNDLVVWDFASEPQRITLAPGARGIHSASAGYAAVTYPEGTAVVNLTTGAMVTTKTALGFGIEDGYLTPSVTKLTSLPVLTCPR